MQFLQIKTAIIFLLKWWQNLFNFHQIILRHIEKDTNVYSIIRFHKM